MFDIVTSYIYPPVPDRNYDWAATYDGYEPGDPIGYGKTEAEAILDLLEQREQ
jgi:hypothetical protein